MEPHLNKWTFCIQSPMSILSRLTYLALTIFVTMKIVQSQLHQFVTLLAILLIAQAIYLLLRPILIIAIYKKPLDYRGNELIVQNLFTKLYIANFDIEELTIKDNLYAVKFTQKEKTRIQNIYGYENKDFERKAQESVKKKANQDIKKQAKNSKSKIIFSIASSILAIALVVFSLSQAQFPKVIESKIVPEEKDSDILLFAELNHSPQRALFIGISDGGGTSCCRNYRGAEVVSYPLVRQDFTIHFFDVENTTNPLVEFSRQSVQSVKACVREGTFASNEIESIFGSKTISENTCPGTVGSFQEFCCIPWHLP